MEGVLKKVMITQGGKLEDNLNSIKEITVQTMIGSRSTGQPEVRDLKPEAKGAAKGTVLQEFYRDTNIFVTGASGFMGKVLIEKLLRSCPNINKIYLMLRSKKGREVGDRIGDILNAPLFERLRGENPEFGSKLVAIAGDVALVGLGISEEHRRLLAEEVNVVFHVAATVRFDEKLDLAIKANVRGTREILHLCRTFKHLKSVIHVSTAYSNCPRMELDECFYPPPLPCDKAIVLAEKFDNSDLTILTAKIIAPWPNTYAFTKALSEDAVRYYGEGLPVGIFRPSIVIATDAEPVGGWIDNMYGPTGVIVGVGSGLLRAMRLDTDMNSNMVPCDMAINGMIASAWDVAEHSESKEMLIYNNVAHADNELKYKDYIQYYSDRKMDYPVSIAIWYYFGVFTKDETLAMVHRVILHYLPAMFVDAFLVLMRKKPMMLRLYQKIHKFTHVLSYFATQHWTFHYKNMDRMWELLDEDDRKIFNFDMKNLDWLQYVINTCCGLRLYMGRETPESLPAARAKMVRLKFLHYTMVTLFFIGCAWFAWKILYSYLSAYL